MTAERAHGQRRPVRARTLPPHPASHTHPPAPATFASVTEATPTLLSLIAGRRGHFEMESGYHADHWFELGRLFDDPPRIQPFIAEEHFPLEALARLDFNIWHPTECPLCAARTPLEKVSDAA